MKGLRTVQYVRLLSIKSKRVEDPVPVYTRWLSHDQVASIRRTLTSLLTTLER